ncbi:MAG: copper resistance protein CopC [Oligoflexia bacterium]|nr:copper resistance protein CopC [Oligoflexia bacterium]
MKRSFSLIPAVLLIALPGLAFAHTHMKSSDPKAEAILDEAPKMVQIRLSEAVLQKLSKLVVTSEKGERVDVGAPAPIPGEETGLEVALKQPLVPGKYQVEWSTVSKDTHKARGSFRFTVSEKK